MKKVLLAIAALSMVVVALAGCPNTPTTQGSTGNAGTSTSAN